MVYINLKYPPCEKCDNSETKNMEAAMTDDDSKRRVFTPTLPTIKPHAADVAMPIPNISDVMSM